MSSTTLTTVSAAPITYGKLRYVSPDYAPKPSTQIFGLPDTSEFGDERIMPLHDIRPLPTVDQLHTAKEGTAQLSTHAFTAVKHASILHSAPYTEASWHDPELLQKVYIPEVEEMLRQITGAKTVISETLLLRSSIKNEQGTPSTNTGKGQNSSSKEAQAEFTSKAQATVSPSPQDAPLPKLNLPLKVGFSPVIGSIPPAPKVHVDYNPAGVRAHIRFFNPTVTTACAPVIAAEDRLLAADLSLSTHYSTTPLAPRWAIYSIWRPLKTVKRDPLAVGDTRTFEKEDYLTIDVPAPTIDSEGVTRGTHTSNAYVAKGRASHRWCYVSEQMPDEVLIIGLWDSDRERDSVGAGGAMHSSVEIEGREGEEPRESLEMRCLAIW